MSSTSNPNLAKEFPLSRMSKNKEYIQLPQQEFKQQDDQLEPAQPKGSFLVCCSVFGITALVVILAQILLFVWLMNKE